MRKFQKISLALFILCIFMGIFSLNVFAASSSYSRDDFEVTLTTDKDEYESDEDIAAVLTVANNSTLSINNLTLENILPDGYILSSTSETLTMEIEELETTVDENTVTTTVNHFSTYILLNKTLFDEVWNSDIKSPDENSNDMTGLDIVFAIDSSGSMSSNDSKELRLEAAKAFVDKLGEDDRAAVVDFDSTASLYQEFTSDHDNLYAAIEKINSSGGTNISRAMSLSISQFTDSLYTRTDAYKYIILLTDGQGSYSSYYTEEAAENDIVVYTIGLGSGVDEELLTEIAEGTGGKYYFATSAEKLSEIYDDISEETIDYSTDSNNDGISDYYTQLLCEGTITLGSGADNPFRGCSYDEVQSSDDFDGDGLVNGDEISIVTVSEKVYVVLTSNPTLTDTDFDGKYDNEDLAPTNNYFFGTLGTDYADSSVAFNFDYRCFFSSNTLYNARLSVVSSLFSSTVYSDNTLNLNNLDASEGDIADILSYFGMSDVKTVSVGQEDNDRSEVALGYRTVTYDGTTKTILAVIVRGTNSTIEEWSSNFDIGNLSEFGTSSASDWKNSENHKGFDVAANRIIEEIDQYISDNALDENSVVYWVTGHSRGAAIANIIGAYFEDEGKTSFTYTFATPNTTLADDAGDYETIFNVVNSDDFVPCLPCESWGYTRYGKTASVSVASNYEKEWESLTGIFDYNPDTFGMQNTIDTMAAILNGDARVECYKYTCSCHGDGSSNNITITNYGMSESSREKAIAKIPENALDYCIITRHDGNWILGWNFDVCQTPMYFMQILAAKMAKDISDFRFLYELNIADRYESAKTAIIRSYLGGLKHPHYTETYYLLSTKILPYRFE